MLNRNASSPSSFIGAFIITVLFLPIILMCVGMKYIDLSWINGFMVVVGWSC